jgi:hypothetical protein
MTCIFTVVKAKSFMVRRPSLTVRASRDSVICTAKFKAILRFTCTGLLTIYSIPNQKVLSKRKKVPTSLSEAAATAGAAKIQLNKYKTFEFVFIVGDWASRKWKDSTSPGNTVYILRREDQQEEEEEGGDQ